VTDDILITGGHPLRGRLRVPGCKGISHRAVLLAAMAEGSSRITGAPDSADVRSTVGFVSALGARVHVDDGALRVESPGADGLEEPAGIVDCANSGSTMRMGAGLVAGRPFLTVLAGDESLSRRPMRRIVEPLRAMGAKVDGRAGGELAPLVVRGGSLHGVRHDLPVASGQVKTALVLAGLQADGATEIHEPAPSRDHTERMLGALGGPVERIDDRTLRVSGGRPGTFGFEVPGDPSSAAFLVVAACLVPGSEITIEGVSLNPGRIAYLDVLRDMGASLEVRPTGEQLGEPVGDVSVTASPLKATRIRATEAIIDELPVLAVAAAFAEGVTEIHDAAELAVKESDRIASVTATLSAFGVAVEAAPDGLAVTGGRPRPTTVDSHGDHRVAMAAAVAALACDGESRILDWPVVAVSYPAFADDLRRLGGGT